MKNFNWKTITIAVLVIMVLMLSVTLAYLIGRGYESEYVQGLQQLKLRTEQFVNQNVSIPNRLIFRQLGYDVDIPLSDTTEARE